MKAPLPGIVKAITVKTKFPNTLELKEMGFGLFDSYSGYQSLCKIFYAHYGKIASWKFLGPIDYLQAIAWVEANLGAKILSRQCEEYYHLPAKKMQYRSVTFLLDIPLLIDINEDGNIGIAYHNTGELATQLAGELTPLVKRPSKKRISHISLVKPGEDGLSLLDLKIQKPKVNLQQNYNDNLAPVHENLLRVIRQKNKSGLILLHGIPGTGKSTYIRYLIQCQSKRAIFMPPALAGNLDSPALTRLLTANAGTVFIIEDAEALIASRVSNNPSGISMLLNLTDGLLGESLGIQFICTFNTRIGDIDKALLRKGRLLAMYEFKPLCAEKSVKLLNELGLTPQGVSKPLTLAEIYNYQNTDYEFEYRHKTPIGFGANKQGTRN